MRSSSRLSTASRAWSIAWTSVITGSEGSPVRAGIEAELEKLDEAAGDLGMPAQRILHIGLAECRSDLPKHLGIEPQHDDLTRRKAGREDEAVEPVILDPTGPYRDNCLLETCSDDLGDSGQQRHSGELEFVDPHRSALDAVDAERLFSDHAQTEIFQYRQHVGKNNRFFGPIEAQPRKPPIGSRVKGDFEDRTRQHRLDPPQIGDRLGGLRPRLIGDREGRYAAQPGMGLLFAEGRRRRLL